MENPTTPFAPRKSRAIQFHSIWMHNQQVNGHKNCAALTCWMQMKDALKRTAKPSYEDLSVIIDSRQVFT